MQGADDEIAFPVQGLVALFNFRWPVLDRSHWIDEPLR